MDNMQTKKRGAASKFAVLIAILALVAASYFYIQLRKFKQNGTLAAEKEVAILVAKVDKIMVLPTDETPTIATVSDKEALKDQAFFANANVGDKVLIYAKAKKAILYSVAMNKIIDIAPLNVNNETVPVQTEITTENKESVSSGL